uniref:Uncharacterized protein n=1 Tax=Mustela putorius furo TaxID=9669 RepID=M3Z6Y0_MUSPF
MGTGASPQGPDAPDQRRPDQELQRRGRGGHKGQGRKSPAGTAPVLAAPRSNKENGNPRGTKLPATQWLVGPRDPKPGQRAGRRVAQPPGKALSLHRPPTPALSAPGTLSNSPASAPGPKPLLPARAHRGREGGLPGTALSPHCPHWGLLASACGDTHAPSRLFANNGPHFENKLFLRQHLPELSLPLGKASANPRAALGIQTREGKGGGLSPTNVCPGGLSRIPPGRERQEDSLAQEPQPPPWALPHTGLGGLQETAQIKDPSGIRRNPSPLGSQRGGRGAEGREGGPWEANVLVEIRTGAIRSRNSAWPAPHQTHAHVLLYSHQTGPPLEKQAGHRPTHPAAHPPTPQRP